MQFLQTKASRASRIFIRRPLESNLEFNIEARCFGPATAGPGTRKPTDPVFGSEIKWRTGRPGAP